MKKIILYLVVLLAVFNSRKVFSQTCCGTIEFWVIDSAANKNISNSLQCRTEFYQSKNAGQYYKLNEKVLNFNEIHSDTNIFIPRDEIRAEEFFTPDTLFKIHGYCGYYLIKQTIINNPDTMRIGFYNVPAHYSFYFSEIPFRIGDYYVNIGDFKRFENTGVGCFFVDKKYLKRF